MNRAVTMGNLDYKLLDLVKKGFVPMPGGQTEPVAGASMATAAMGAPIGGDPGMDPNMMGGDPGVMGGMSPEMMGMDPGMMDPNMMGMDPSMVGMDPNMMGGDPAELEALMAQLQGGAPGGEGTITLTVDQLIQLLEAVSGMGGGKAASSGTAKGKGNSTEDKLNTIIGMLGGSV